MLKNQLNIYDKINIYIYPSIAALATITFALVSVPIANEFHNKNYCVQMSSKQLYNKLPESFIKESKLKRKELVKMLAYQLCTHRNPN